MSCHLSKAAVNAGSPYAAEAIGNTFSEHGSLPNGWAWLAAHGALGAITAKANGGNAGAGALSAAGAELVVSIAAEKMFGDKALDENGKFNAALLSEGEKKQLSALGAATGAALGLASGGNSHNAQTGGVVAMNAVENNYLDGDQTYHFANALRKYCKTGNEESCKAVIRTYKTLDKYQHSELVKTCSQKPDSHECGRLIGRAQKGDVLIYDAGNNLADIHRNGIEGGPFTPEDICGQNKTCLREIKAQDRRNISDKNYYQDRPTPQQIKEARSSRIAIDFPEDISDIEAVTIYRQWKEGIISSVGAIAASKGIKSSSGAKTDNPSRSSASVQSKSQITFNRAVEWKNSNPKGTGIKYRIHQRNDINWSQIRTSGDKKFIGKTNQEAAQKGLAPQLPDGSFATLHHIGQKSTGPLVEASTRYHGVGKYGQDILHSQYGRRTGHPTLQPDRKLFKSDNTEYWKWRVNHK